MRPALDARGRSGSGVDASAFPAGGGSAPAWLPALLRILVLGLGAAHTAVAMQRQAMNEDGINYLDLGAAYIRGDWAHAINGIWSPLYAWMLGAAIEIVRPSIRHEFEVVHAVNFAIFGVALVCFEFFWRELTASCDRERTQSATAVRFHPAVWLTLGYSLFAWSSLNLIAIWAVTPDMTVAAVVYLAAGLMLRSCRRDNPQPWLAWLGTVLGLGYLAKAALFPLGIVALLLVAVVNAAGVAAAVRRGAWGLLPFALVAGPFVLALSLASGQPTFGDVGRFTYMKHVNGLRYPHWEESIREVAGRPEHPPRQVFESPGVYEFASPVGGTYPLSFDPGYWTRGLSPRLDVGRQVSTVIVNLQFYFDFFVRMQGGFAAIVLVLWLVAISEGGRPASALPQTVLVVWALIAFSLYSLVYIAPRYIAPFAVLFWSGLLGSIRLPDTGAYRRLASAGGALLVGAVWINIGAFNLAALAAAVGPVPAAPAAGSPAAARLSDGAHDPHPEIAERLLALGVKRGDRVAFIGQSFTAFWARLARLRIVAEIPHHDAEKFWTSDPDTRAAVLDVMARTGASAVVADRVPGGSLPADWHRLGGTGYVVRLLPEARSAAAR